LKVCVANADGSVQAYARWVVEAYEVLKAGQTVPALPGLVSGGNGKLEIQCAEGYESSEDDDEDTLMDDGDVEIASNGPTVDDEGFTLVQSKRKK
jgi:hypothetical protein